MAHAPAARRSPDRHGTQLDRRPASHEATLALRLVPSGLVLAALAIVCTAAGLDAWVGPLSLLGLLALTGLLMVVAGGALALTAILRHGERSALALATLPAAALALLAVLAQIIFHVP